MIWGFRTGVTSQPADTQPADPLARLLDAAALHAALAGACAAGWGFVLAILDGKHSPSARFLAQEQADFATNHVAYLALTPALSARELTPETGELDVALDGAALGRAPAAAVIAALQQASALLPARRILVLHGFAGHGTADLLALAAALRPQARWAWLHDHGALCAGAALLRNDIAPCGAPPASSHSCLVCRHGEERAAHLLAVARLFAGLQAQVVAPTAAALALWRRAGPLPSAAACVQAPWRLPTRRGPAAAHPDLGLPENPVRVAFIGAAAPSAWAGFAEILRSCRRLPTYRFLQIAGAADLRAEPGVEAVALPDGSDFPIAAAVAAHRIDIALCLAPSPDRFDAAAAEAAAGGALVLALAGSGAGDATILLDRAALARFFTAGTAIAEARRLADRGRPVREGVVWNTTAMLHASGQAAAARTSDDPGLVVLAAEGPCAVLREGLALQVALPAGGRLRLLSRRKNGRGLAVSRLLLDGVEIAAGNTRLLAGWQADQGVLYTDGDATLDAGPARLLVLELVAGAIYPRLPALG